jgi:glycosyltransferase involved in cell wall biosynthesis
MRGSFNRDPYPGRPKILFVGLAESSHTHSWIDLLSQAELNVRLFAMPSGLPPKDWEVRTYVTHPDAWRLDPETRVSLYPQSWIKRFYKKRLMYLLPKGFKPPDPQEWLAKIMNQWQPDVIHTVGLDPAGYFYFDVSKRFGLHGDAKWVLQLRGGSDLILSRLDPLLIPRIKQVVCRCDQLVSDNQQNFRAAIEMGLREEQISALGTIPGTGGIDVSSLAQSWHGLPSKRRMILWPKAYECPWSKALPVFEALKLIWDKIQPCHVSMLAMNSETCMWYWALPERIRKYCQVEDRIPRDKVLELMVQARVMLAPSLVDGTPNTMLEAMATGAFPILSPLETIRSLVENERNVLFARNLYPEEIAQALCRAMTDDTLVDRAAERNLELVREIGDRSKIRPRVVEFYEKVAKQQERRKQ